MYLSTYLRTSGVAFMLLLTTSLFAQVDESRYLGQTVIIELRDGLEFRGTVLSLSDTTARIQTANGPITLHRSTIASMEIDDYEGEYRFPNPQDTRYFFAPSARPLEKGELYYQNLMLVGNFVNYGVTDNFSIGGGVEFISTFLGNPIWFLTPKLGFPIGEDWHVGAGVFAGGLGVEGMFGLTYGVVTYGNIDNNISFGAGAATDFQNFFFDVPVYTISGTVRLSNSISLLSENYILPGFGGSTFFGIEGIRVMSEKNAFDIGLIVFPELLATIPLPYVGYSRSF